MSDEMSDEVWEAMKDEYADYCVKCGNKSHFYKGSEYEFGVCGVYICCRCNYAYPPISNEDAVNMKLITKNKLDKLIGVKA